MRSKSIKHICYFFALFVFSSVFAQTEAPAKKEVQLSESYGDLFLNYRPFDHKKDTPKEKKEPSSTKPKEPESVKVDVEWLKKNYPVLEQKAIDNPSKENIEAYLYTKRVILDKAQRFSEAVMKTTNEDPFLNENNRIPYATSGSASVRSADYQAQQKALRELSETGGLIVFVDGVCRFCEKQLPILKSIRNEFGLEYLVISTDGRAPKSADKFVKDNGLFRKLSLQLTPTIVYVPKPKAYSGQDPNKYLIVSQGYYAQDELIKQIAFAGFNSSLLSKNVMKDLDVWNTGVVGSSDLVNLRIKNPSELKSVLQPYLTKQYK